MEYTGPADSINPGDPSTFKIPLRTIMTAQRALWNYGVRAFHDSIGSMTLLRDFRKWEDRAYITKLLESPNIYNPQDIPDGGVYPVGPQKITVKEDVLSIVEKMRTANVPKQKWALVA